MSPPVLAIFLLYLLVIATGGIVALLVATWRARRKARKLDRKARAFARLANLTVFTSHGQRLNDIAALEFGTRRRDGETDDALIDRLTQLAIANPDLPDCAIWRHRP